LKLRAEDPADLEIMSAAVQDALLRVNDIVIDRKQRRFTAMISRFRWEIADQAQTFERVRAAVSFEGVLGVKSRRVRNDTPEALASVLSLGFVPDEEPPGGIVRLMLAGGGEIALEVECLDAVLLDVGEVWRTPRKPDHEKA